MGQIITGTLTFNASFVEHVATGVITPYDIPAAISANLGYATGTASGQVDTIYSKAVSLASTTLALDLTTLLDPAGIPITFARVREFIVVVTSVTASFDLKVYAGASSGVVFLPVVANFLPVRYSGSLRLSDPTSTGAGNGNCVDGTHKNLVLDSGSNTVTAYILIVGGSAA